MTCKFLRDVVLLVLAMPLGLFGQELAGRVTSGGNPVVGANVAVRALKIGTTTDADGKYKLQLAAGTYDVTFSSVGYKAKTMSVTVAVSATTTVDVVLEEAPKQLADIVIVGGRASTRTVTDSPLPIDVLPVRELSSTGQNTFDKMLQYRVPSFNTVQTPVNDATALLDPWRQIQSV